MSLLTYNELVKLWEANVLTYADGSRIPKEHINGASIDITLGNVFKEEVVPEAFSDSFFDLREGDDSFREVVIPNGDYFILHAKEFILAETREFFNLPDDVACEYKLKSSLARCGLQHLLAGWGDPSWYGSTMTLEFVNARRYKLMQLYPGMKIGQVVFWRGEAVPESQLYRHRGQYNNQSKAQGSKGVK